MTLTCETLIQLTQNLWEESLVHLGFQNCSVKFKFHLKMIRKKKEKKESAPLKIEAFSPANFRRARFQNAEFSSLNHLGRATSI